MKQTVGAWAYLIGVVLAIVFGLVNYIGGTATTILVILGLIIGLLNIADKEVKPFLMAGAILVIVSALGADVLSAVGLIGNVLNALLALFVPATVIVALKSVFTLAKN